MTSARFGRTMTSARQLEKPFTNRTAIRLVSVNLEAAGVAMSWHASFPHGGGRVEHAGSVTPRNEGRNPEVACSVAIAQGAAVRKRHRSAGRCDERMASRHVPLAGRGESRVNVGQTFRNPAEFQR